MYPSQSAARRRLTSGEGQTVRYRRLSYRYAVVLASGGGAPAGDPGPWGESWRVGRPGVSLAQPSWCPPFDVYETESSIWVTIELAGVEEDELDALLFEDALVVEGRRRLPPAEPRGVYHAARIRQGPFRLEIPLPAPIDPERIEARYERGLLQVTFVKIDRR